MPKEKNSKKADAEGKYIKPKYRDRETRESVEPKKPEELEMRENYEVVGWPEMTVGQVVHNCRMGYDKQKQVRADLGLELSKKNSSEVGEYSQLTYTPEQMTEFADANNMFMVKNTETGQVFIVRGVREYRG